jgi:hypothetical protein
MIDPELLGPPEHMPAEYEAALHDFIFGTPPESVREGEYETTRNVGCNNEGCRDYDSECPQSGMIGHFDNKVAFYYACGSCFNERKVELTLSDFDEAEIS